MRTVQSINFIKTNNYKNGTDIVSYTNSGELDVHNPIEDKSRFWEGEIN